MPPKGKRGGKSAGGKKEEKKEKETSSSSSSVNKDKKVDASAAYRSATGVLHSQPRALDVKIGGFTLTW